MVSTSPRPGARRLRIVSLSSLLGAAAIAAAGGIFAISHIDKNLSTGPSESAQILAQVHGMQLGITEAIEEARAYLVSGEESEKLEFLEWAEAFPGNIQGLRVAFQRTDKNVHKDSLRLEGLLRNHEQLVATSKELFLEFEENGAVDHDSFLAYEEIISHSLAGAQKLSTIRLQELEDSTARFQQVVALSTWVVVGSSIAAILSALLAATYLFKLCRKEQTHRKRAEAAFRLAEQSHQELYDHTPDMHISVSAATSRLVACNQTTADVLGYTREELIGKEILKIYHPDSLSQAQICLKDFIDTGRASADHLQLITAAGDPIDVSLRVTAVRDEKGYIVRSQSVCRDIRAQVRVEEALRAGEARYRTLVENAPVCIHEIDLGGRLTNMNTAGLEMLGETDSSTVAGIPYVEFVRQDDRARIEALMQEAIAGNASDFEFSTPDEPPSRLRSSFVPIRDHADKIVRLMGVTQDLTAHYNSENALRQKQKMEAVGRLAGGVAHDFNNLLTIIVGYCEELGRSMGAESVERHQLGQISGAANQASSLTRQLLQFSRNQELKPVVLNLNAVIENLEEILTRLIGDDISLEIRYDSQLGWIQADPGQVEQILMNLAANARDAMPSGGTLLLETTAQTRMEGMGVGLRVSDTGAGISEAVRERIFEPFYTTKDAGQGSGLGLATVLGIVQKNGGEIAFDSELGKGTVVSLEFPTCEAPAPPMTSQPENSESLDMAGCELILLAEDQEPIRRLTKASLEYYGYQVLEAENGVEALKLLQEHSDDIALLITDALMPKMGGEELIIRAAEVAPSLRVLMVSGYVGATHSRALPEYVTLIAKPYHPSDLAAAIRKVLDGVSEAGRI